VGEGDPDGQSDEKMVIRSGDAFAEWMNTNAQGA